MSMLTATAACLPASGGLCILAARRCGLRLQLFRAHVGGIAAASILTAVATHDATLESAIVLAVCAAAAVSDLQTGYILDGVVIPAAAALVAIAVIDRTLDSYALGALIAAGVPLMLFIVTRGTGIGFGDVKLGLCIGALGLTPALHVVEAAFITGGCVAAALLVLRGRSVRKTRMPFAPFLLIGVLMTLLFQGGNG